MLDHLQRAFGQPADGPAHPPCIAGPGAQDRGAGGPSRLLLGGKLRQPRGASNECSGKDDQCNATRRTHTRDTGGTARSGSHRHATHYRKTREGYDPLTDRPTPIRPRLAPAPLPTVLLTHTFSVHNIQLGGASRADGGHAACSLAVPKHIECQQ